jgi:hypothetical protein
MEELKIATWNVRRMSDKETGLINELDKKQINIIMVTGTEKKLKGTQGTGDHTVIYSGVGKTARAESN